MFLLPSLLYYGRSGLRPSLVQGLRPRNAPLQNQSRRGASVYVIPPLIPASPSRAVIPAIRRQPRSLIRAAKTNCQLPVASGQ